MGIDGLSQGDMRKSKGSGLCRRGDGRRFVQGRRRLKLLKSEVII